ncbi:MAG: hypothetical protein K0Q97_742 [Bacillota bacterium]|jgi:DegV family protein with EDD domain|nr:hypothetical protein [Bacillota bacterium]
MGIRLVVDSTADVTSEIKEKYNIKMVPLSVNFGDDSFLDGIEISTGEFFEKLAKSEKLPTTSQVPPGKFVEAFSEIIESGDEIIGIFIGSKLSGTYESARAAKEIVGSENIYLIDSESASLGEFALVMRAIDLIAEKKSAKEIYEILEQEKEKLEVVIALDTLMYLEKGGRISKGQAVVGSILGVKPVIQIKKNKIDAIDKVRGKNKAIKWFDSWIAQNNIDLTNKDVFLFHSQNTEQLKVLKAEFETKYKTKNIFENEVGCVIGTHVGPGVLAVGFLNN